MGRVFLDISTSLDGYVAGPNPSLEHPLGEGGELLHEWVFPLAAWRKPHGLDGGITNASSEVIEEVLGRQGAVVMGRRMFSGGAGAWEDDPKAYGWWGDDPPFHVPVFVVTHHAREPLAMEGGTVFTFVTEGVEAAIERARAAAGGRDVAISGGASVAQQALAARLLDEIRINLTPVLLGGGTRLFDDAGSEDGPRLEQSRVVESAGVTHLHYRVAK
jgi:dihydrofolate reductase